MDGVICTVLNQERNTGSTGKLSGKGKATLKRNYKYYNLHHYSYRYMFWCQKSGRWPQDHSEPGHLSETLLFLEKTTESNTPASGSDHSSFPSSSLFSIVSLWVPGRPWAHNRLAGGAKMEPKIKCMTLRLPVLYLLCVIIWPITGKRWLISA